jgi:hypothetical protein
VYLIDGDHNYFTVVQELLWIERIQQKANKPFFCILHDVGWPWAYRDLYYNPESIPEEWRQPYTWERGLTLDNPETVEGGFRGCGAWACACHEGGERNGVLKAVEDFISLRGSALEFAMVPGVFGLGVLYSTESLWSGAMKQYLAPLDRNPLLIKLERNRLENYLCVIELQDQSQKAAKEEVAHAG